MDAKAVDKLYIKLMTKTRLKGVFKKVDTLEECDVVLIMYMGQTMSYNFVTKKVFYEKMLNITSPMMMLYYLKYSNPRPSASVSRRLMDKVLFQ